MRDAHVWHPTKFEMGRHGLRGSRDRRYLAPGSLVVADSIARHYERMLRNHARGQLLDVGAGLAPLFGVYRDLVERVTCVDWEQSLHASPHIDVHADLTQTWPFSPATFDTILMADVLEHLPSAEHAFGEVSRLLRAGGKLLLGVPFFYWVHERPNDYARYTDDMLRWLAERAGLKVLELEPTGGSPEVLLDFLSKHMAVLGPLGRLLPLAAGQTLRLPLVQQVSRKSSRWFPLGYVLVAQRTA